MATVIDQVTAEIAAPEPPRPSPSNASPRSNPLAERRRHRELTAQGNHRRQRVKAD